MIVVDTNALIYALEPGPLRGTMEAVHARDSRWAAPRLWRSEFRNYLAKRIRRGDLGLEQALLLTERAGALLGPKDHDVSTPAVLDHCRSSGCSGYDAEFVALALAWGVPLVTADGGLLAAFPGIAVSPQAFAARGR